MMPAARMTDFHICPSSSPSPHIGGPLLPPCASTVTIGGQPAARVGDRASCACALDVVVEGAITVLIEGKPAARMGDPCVEGLIITGEASVLIGGSRGKLGLDFIRANYQVQGDTTTMWGPKAWGLIPIPFMDERELTQTEADMLDRLSASRGLLGLDRFKDIRDLAFDVSEERYPAPSVPPPNAPIDNPQTPQNEYAAWILNDGQRDAFRHAYWNALLTSEFGEEWTGQYAIAHEALPGNPATREAMDLYNNEVGRQIAAHNPGASDERLAELIQQAADDGDLVVIDANGNLARSNDVPLWRHGTTGNASLPGVQPVPGGNASAR